jgi:hypothetical protein
MRNGSDFHGNLIPVFYYHWDMFFLSFGFYFIGKKVHVFATADKGAYASVNYFGHISADGAFVDLIELGHGERVIG